MGEGDIGPNTGGMGAYSPAPVVTPAVESQVLAATTYCALTKDFAPAPAPLTGIATVRKTCLPSI